MNVFQAVLLGLLQGITEFLPISSSGHLIVVRKLLGLEGDFLLFDLAVHVGTLGAVCAHYYKQIAQCFVYPFRRIGLLILASVPAVLVGFLWGDRIAAVMESGRWLWLCFACTALLLWLSGRAAKKANVAPFGVKNAMCMGLMQAVAVLPGLSRSGSTIAGGLLSGGKRDEVATFSFLMSIPIIAGSALLQTVSVLQDGVLPVSLAVLMAGTATAFVSGFWAIKRMIKGIEEARFGGFCIYLLALSVLSLIVT